MDNHNQATMTVGLERLLMKKESGIVLSCQYSMQESIPVNPGQARQHPKKRCMQVAKKDTILCLCEDARLQLSRHKLDCAWIGRERIRACLPDDDIRG